MNLSQKILKNFKKSFAMLLVFIMISSIFSGIELSYAYADDFNFASEENEEDFSEYGKGDITTSSDIINDTESLSNEEFEMQFATDADPDNDICLDGSAYYPAEVDNSTSRFFPQIRTQGGIGSCVCWAEVYYAFTYAYCKAVSWPAPPILSWCHPH